jgi:hypothetical protein
MSINIYKISCNISGLQYYGSTSESIDKRLQGHQNSYKRYVDDKTNYTSSFEIIKNDNYTIELMEECNDENRDERESYYIRNFECVNKVIPDRTKKEYMKEYQKEYYENNKEYHKEYHKEYRENNKEKISEKKKEYYENNKERINEIRKGKYTCECGLTIRKDSKAKHEKSIKHLEFINLKI